MNWGARRPETLVPRTPDSLRVCTLGICASIDCYLARPQPGDGNVRARRDGASIVSVFFFVVVLIQTSNSYGPDR